MQERLIATASAQRQQLASPFGFLVEAVGADHGDGRATVLELGRVHDGAQHVFLGHAVGDEGAMMVEAGGIGTTAQYLDIEGLNEGVAVERKNGRQIDRRGRREIERDRTATCARRRRAVLGCAVAAEHVAIFNPGDQLVANVGPVEQAGGEGEEVARPVVPVSPVLFHNARLFAFDGLAHGVGQVAVVEIEKDALHRAEGREDFARGRDVAGDHRLAERQRVHHRQTEALIIRRQDDDAAGRENLVHLDVGNDAGVKLAHVGGHVIAALAHDKDRQAGDGFA